MLLGDCPSSNGVESHDSIVICRSQGVEELCANGEEGHVLYVGVVFRRVGNYVMYIVVALPPADRETTQKVGNDDADAGIEMEVVCNAHVASIMSSKGELVPEEAKEET